MKNCFLSAYPNVEFLQGTIQRIEDRVDGARVTVDGQTLRARCILMNLRDALPEGSERAAISNFMSRAWLLEEMQYARNAAGEEIRAFAQALKEGDADAVAPTFSA
jgi:hypothetical protein